MTDARHPAMGAGKQCPDFEALSCYVDGELDSERAATVGAHADGCPRCATLALRLREGFEADDARRDAGIGGSGCVGDEAVVLYAAGGLAGGERVAVEAHVGSCDSCLRAVIAVRHRLAATPAIAAPVPPDVQLRARVAAEQALREWAPTPAPVRPAVLRPAPRWFERLREVLRVPVLVPAAMAAAALLALTVVRQAPTAVEGERSRAIAPAAVSLRVTAVEAPVHARPSRQSDVVANVQRGTRLPVAGEERDWYEVRLEDGRAGWVAREAFE